jgi:hypothetical protein
VANNFTVLESASLVEGWGLGGSDDVVVVVGRSKIPIRRCHAVDFCRDD